MAKGPPAPWVSWVWPGLLAWKDGSVGWLGPGGRDFRGPGAWTPVVVVVMAVAVAVGVPLLDSAGHPGPPSGGDGGLCGAGQAGEGAARRPGIGSVTRILSL